MKTGASRQISRPDTKPPPKTMLTENEICNLTGSRLDACPKVGANCRGSKYDSKNRGYVGEGKVLAMVRLYTLVYEFRPLSEEVKALRLGALRLCRLDYA